MRIDATNPKIPDYHKYLFQCDCFESLYLEVSWWEDDSPAFLEITPTRWSETIWGRIKSAFKVLFHMQDYSTYGIGLQGDTIDELISTLEEVKQTGKGKSNDEV